MKILYINSLDKRYGSTYRSRNIVKALLELGHNVMYVESNLGDDIFKNSISITQKDSLFGYFTALCRRALITLKLDYDILYLQKFIPLTVPCLIIGKLRKKKCIVDWDDLDFTYQENFVKKIIIFLCEHTFPYLADFITTHSQRLKKYAHRLGIKRVEIINQIVDFGEFNISEEEKGALKEQIGAKNKKILCFLGTLTFGGARDLDVVIKAVSYVSSKRDDIFFLIIGGGPLHKKISGMLKQFGLLNNSYITGLIPHYETKKYLSITDIGLIYMRDNLGNRMRVSFKVLEYLSLGVPIVGYLVGETKEKFSKYCFSCDSHSDLVEKIVFVLDDYKCLNNQNISLQLQDYNLDSIKVSLTNVLK